LRASNFIHRSSYRLAPANEFFAITLRVRATQLDFLRRV